MERSRTPSWVLAHRGFKSHPFRQDLVSAYELAWLALSQPGTWWTGQQRRTLASTALLALADSDPVPPWVGVTSVTGKIEWSQEFECVPAIAHDAAYRIARHAATLTADWYSTVIQQIDPLAFIELCGVVCTVAAVTSFRNAVGLEVLELAPAKIGQPSRSMPENIQVAQLNWVPVIGPADQEAAVVQAFTAVPETNRLIWQMADAQYIPDKAMVDPHWTRGTLTRIQMEFIAMRVSQQRECFY